MNEKILIVEDEETLRDSLTRVFAREGYLVHGVGSAEPAMSLLQEEAFALVLTDIILPGISGIELLKWIKDSDPDQVVIIMTAYASLETAVETLRSGAYDYVVKPIIHEELKQIVKSALKARVLQKENILLKKQISGSYDLSRIIGQHPEILQIIARVKKIVETKNNVLIIGEVGTGKRLLARAIHFSSSRADKPFKTVNLRAIPASLRETKLFGKRNDSIIGAERVTHGLLEEANGGTIYLSGIEQLSLDLQQKLLDALVSQKFQPPWKNESIPLDLAFISSANEELSNLVAAGRFHEDLFCQLQGVTFRIPPLHDRLEDLEPLTRFFLNHYNSEFGKTVLDITAEAMAECKKYRWPGNIRELRAILERAVLICPEAMIDISHLPVLRNP